MALTNNNLEIIKALAKNDIHAARRAALASLAEDNTKKNEWAVKYYRKLLIGNASVLMSNLPTDLQTILVGSTPDGFDASRYYERPEETAVIDDIVKMKVIADEMSLRRIPYKNTTLLYGASGTGKTEMGKYIAYKLRLPFFYVNFTSAIDSYMGSTAKNIHKIFAFCNSIPCVLMLDEVDCIAARRESGGSKGVDGELERTTIGLMQELDILPNHVTLIAATNRLDMVDEALMRRFSIKHEVKDMTRDELRSLAVQVLNATDTGRFVSAQKVRELTEACKNPGQLMPELYKEIGRNLYEAKKDEIKDKEEEENKLDLWEVTYSWKKNIAAETEEDAIAIARHERNRYANADNEFYSAKRAEFLIPAEKS